MHALTLLRATVTHGVCNSYNFDYFMVLCMLINVVNLYSLNCFRMCYFYLFANFSVLRCNSVSVPLDLTAIYNSLVHQISWETC